MNKSVYTCAATSQFLHFHNVCKCTYVCIGRISEVNAVIIIYIFADKQCEWTKESEDFLSFLFIFSNYNGFC